MIVDPASLQAFTIAVLVILIAPGPDMMFMIGTGLNAGRRGAIVAAYLTYLGLSTWRNAGPVSSIDEASQRSISEVFRRGFIVNITNPKVALFIAAFIPRFVEPSRGNTTAQFLSYALTFQAIGLVVDLVIGIGAGSARHFLMQRPSAARNLDRLAATVYLAIAAWLVIDLVAVW